MRVCKYDIVIMRKAEYRRALGKKFFRALAMHGGVTVPSKPKKPCAYPGCPALVTGRYCEEHARNDVVYIKLTPYSQRIHV